MNLFLIIQIYYAIGKIGAVDVDTLTRAHKISDTGDPVVDVAAQVAQDRELTPLHVIYELLISVIVFDVVIMLVVVAVIVPVAIAVTVPVASKVAVLYMVKSAVPTTIALTVPYAIIIPEPSIVIVLD